MKPLTRALRFVQHLPWCSSPVGADRSTVYRPSETCVSQQGVKSLELPRLGWTDDQPSTDESIRALVTAQYQRWRHPVFGFIRQRVRNDGDAEELTQETFLRLYVYLRDGHVVTHHKAFIYKAAANVVLNFCRDQAVRMHALTTADADPCCHAEPIDITLDRRADLASLNAAIPLLPTLQRRCVELRRQDLRVGEIANRLNCHISTVKSSLARATTKLQEQLTARHQPRTLRPSTDSQ